MQSIYSNELVSRNMITSIEQIYNIETAINAIARTKSIKLPNMRKKIFIMQGGTIPVVSVACSVLFNDCDIYHYDDSSIDSQDFNSYVQFRNFFRINTLLEKWRTSDESLSLSIREYNPAHVIILCYSGLDRISNFVRKIHPQSITVIRIRKDGDIICNIPGNDIYETYFDKNNTLTDNVIDYWNLKCIKYKQEWSKK